MMKCNGWLLTLFTLCGLLTSCAVNVPAADPPVMAPSTKRIYSQMKLSPDGKFLAALTPYRDRQNIVVIDLATSRGRVVTGMDHDITTFWWANDKRLLFTLTDERHSSGLYAVGRDGSNPKMLAPKAKASLLPGAATARYAVLAQTIRSKGDEVIVVANDRSETSADVYRVNVNSGRRTLLTRENPGQVQAWVLDHNGAARVAIARDALSTRIYHRSDEKSPLAQIAEFKAPERNFKPVGFAEDNKTLYVLSDAGREKAAIYSYDPDAKKIGDLVFGRDDVGVEGLLLDSYTGKLLGFSYGADKSGVTWVDERYQRLQKQLDATLNNAINEIRSASEDGSRFVVYSYSPTTPGAFYLFDADRNTIEKIEL